MGVRSWVRNSVCESVILLLRRTLIKVKQKYVATFAHFFSLIPDQYPYYLSDKIALIKIKNHVKSIMKDYSVDR